MIAAMPGRPRATPLRRPTTRIARALLVALAALPAVALAGIAAGPYVTRVGPTEARILFESDGPGSCLLDDGREFPAVRDAATRVAACAVAGLTPGARVGYRVRSGGDEAAGSVRAAPPPGASFSMVVLGDTQEDLPDETHAEAIRAVLRDVPTPDLYVHTGDLVADSRAESQWTRFFQVERDLLARAAWVPAIGNHDTMGRAGRALCRRYLPTGAWSFRYGPAFFLVLETNGKFDRTTEHFGTAWRALVEAAADPTVAFRFVICHKPPVTTGHHPPNATLLADYVDLFERYGVDVVFSGHNHLYEHGLVNGVHYVVTGGGGGQIVVGFETRPWSVAGAMVHHYCRVTVGPERYTVAAIGTDGKVLDTFSGDRTEGGRPGRLPRDLLHALGRRGACGLTPADALLPGGIALLVLAGILRRRKTRRAGA
jgi:predicted phosphodiesterase